MRFVFSVVSPMHNVARYLPAFLRSLERQTFGFDRLQVVLVDDGSTDDTLMIARGFARRHPANVLIVHQHNQGQASARNAALDLVDGEWITFPDSDDVLEPGYFAAVAKAMRSHDADMFSARILMWRESPHRVTDDHALAWRFGATVKTVRLRDEPRWIQPHVTSGFVRREVIDRESLRFQPELRLRFEDGDFVAAYLLAVPDASVCFVPDARYRYRQRADGSSTVQSTAGDPRKYTNTIRYGFTRLVADAVARYGTVPRWAQNLMLYDQFWILRSSLGARVRMQQFPSEMHAELATLIPWYLQQIDDEAIRSFDLMPIAAWMPDVLLLLKHEGGAGAVRPGPDDRLRGLSAHSYVYRGDVPAESIVIDGLPGAPRFSKSMPIEYAAGIVCWLRTLWVPLDAEVAIAVEGSSGMVSGQPSTLSNSPRTVSHSSGRWATPARMLRKVLARGRSFGWRRAATHGARIMAGVALSMLPPIRRRFDGAWLLIDRDVDSDDSAEVLYRWLRTEHPEINAWFSVRRSSAHWARLRAEGVRLVPYGSPLFLALLRVAEHVASSHADRFITHVQPSLLGSRKWTFTFLQHGVIKGDISGWLNSKDIDVFVTSTDDEYRYITGTSPFRVGAKEVRLTGLPRFDDLLAKDAEVAVRDVLLVMPTWRDYLVGDMSKNSRSRSAVDGFRGSEYERQWSAFLTHPDLADGLEQHDIRLVFLPHPNMYAALGHFDLPSHVEVLAYDDIDVRALVARSRVMVTDYSSAAFNMAYVQRPVVYFQFDRADYTAGHTERPGYFEYERDGFGPVAETLDSAVADVVGALTGRPDREFRDRMLRTFPVRDGRNCERVFLAMREARTIRSLDERRVAAPAESWARIAEEADQSG